MTKELSPHAATAAAIRAELKTLGVKAKVKSESFAGGNAVDVYLEDVHPEKFHSIQTICKKYQYGEFDGMTDCYNYTNRNDSIPQVKYVCVSNKPSDKLSESIFWGLKKEMPVMLKGVDEYPADPWNFRFVLDDGDHVNLSTMIHRAFHNVDFWENHLSA